MFYCENCRKENGWPEGFIRSYGMCEVCDARADCYDVHHSYLNSEMTHSPPTSLVEETLEKLIGISAEDLTFFRYRPSIGPCGNGIDIHYKNDFFDLLINVDLGDQEVTAYGDNKKSHKLSISWPFSGEKFLDNCKNLVDILR